MKLVCSSCKQLKDASLFGEAKTPRGFRYQCKSCDKTAFAAWRTSRKDQWAAYQREWRKTNSSSVSAHLKSIGYASQKKWNKANKPRRAFLSAKRIAAEKQATPAWADLSKIAYVYEVAGVFRDAGLDVQVDHIVPLQGKNVCGLHVENNLQLLLKKDNVRKNNKHEP